MIKALFVSWRGGLKEAILDINIEQFVTKEASLIQFEKLMPIIDQEFDLFFKQKLSAKMPMISMFIGDNTIVQLKTIFIAELQQLFPILVDQFLHNSKFELASNLETKWRKKLESDLLNATKKFRIVAIIIGFLWGVITLALIHLL